MCNLRPNGEGKCWNDPLAASAYTPRRFVNITLHENEIRMSDTQQAVSGLVHNPPLG